MADRLRNTDKATRPVAEKKVDFILKSALKKMLGQPHYGASPTYLLKHDAFGQRGRAHPQAQGVDARRQAGSIHSQAGAGGG